jgi:alpha-tubulin suppressor-like RCC1 family protein
MDLKSIWSFWQGKSPILCQSKMATIPIMPTTVVTTFDPSRNCRIEIFTYPHFEKDVRHLCAFGNDSHGQVTGWQHLHNHTAVEDVSELTIPTMVSPTILTWLSWQVCFVRLPLQSDLVTFGWSKHGQCLLPPGEKWKPSNANLAFVSCGRYHTVVLNDLGRVWSMGKNQFGQLGRTIDEYNTIESTSSFGKTKSSDIFPIPQLMDGPFGIDHVSLAKEWRCVHRCVELTSGWSHVIARVDIEPLDDQVSDSQSVFGWGRSDKGQLGFQQMIVNVPQNLDTFHSTTSSTASVISTACGSDSTHFLVLSSSSLSSNLLRMKDNDFYLYSVGWNEHGNLGIGGSNNATEERQEDILKPQSISGLERVVSLGTCTTDSLQQRLLMAAGGAHMLIL